MARGGKEITEVCRRSSDHFITISIKAPEVLGAQGWAPGQSDAVLGIWIVAGAVEENNCGDLVVDRRDRPKT